MFLKTLTASVVSQNMVYSSDTRAVHAVHSTFPRSMNVFRSGTEASNRHVVLVDHPMTATKRHSLQENFVQSKTMT